MSFRPVLKPDHAVPFDFSRLCPACGYATLCINMRRDNLHIKCVNGFCARALAPEPIPCVLKHRQYQKTDFQFVIQDAVAFQKNGLLNPFDDAMKPSAIAGPYEDCKGHLIWDPHGTEVTRAAYVFCSDCEARYHIFALATYGHDEGSDDGVLSHGMFRATKDADGRVKIVDAARADASAKRIPLETLLLCDEIIWQGDRVVDSEPFYGEAANKLIW